MRTPQGRSEQPSKPRAKAQQSPSTREKWNERKNKCLKELTALSYTIEDLALTIKAQIGTPSHLERLSKQLEELKQQRKGVEQEARKELQLDGNSEALKIAFSEAPKPLLSKEHLDRLYDDMMKLVEDLTKKGRWSRCLPVLLVPSHSRLMDERHIAVWCVDHEYKELGIFFPFRATFKEFSRGSEKSVEVGSNGHTTSYIMDPLGMTHHWIALHLRLLILRDQAGKYIPMPREQFLELWQKKSFKGEGWPPEYCIDYKTSCELKLGYPSVGDELKEAEQGRQVWEKAHCYFQGKLTREGAQIPSRLKQSPPLYNKDEQDARYLGSAKHAALQKGLLEKYGEKTTDISINEVKFYIHSCDKTKEVLKEYGVWDDFIADSKDSVDHIISPIWGGADHFMNYFIMPKGTNSAFQERFYLDQTGKKKLEKVGIPVGDTYVNKRSFVGYEAYHTAQLLQGVALCHVKEGPKKMSDLINEVKERGPKIAKDAKDAEKKRRKGTGKTPGDGEGSIGSDDVREDETLPAKKCATEAKGSSQGNAGRKSPSSPRLPSKAGSKHPRSSGSSQSPKQGGGKPDMTSAAKPAVPQEASNQETAAPIFVISSDSDD